VKGSEDIGRKIEFIIRIGSKERLLGTRIKHSKLGRTPERPVWTVFIGIIPMGFGMLGPFPVLDRIFPQP
jgi:hypothetical protein